jgi:cytochrome c oxidase assembly protein subunit 15
MDGTDLVNLAPIARMALLGLVLALGPLAWVWVRTRGADPARRLHVLTLLTLFLTFDLVLFGAFTRLTDSGLGCPDWPGCYGNASPFGARHEIHVAQAAMPDGPVTHDKAWVEMIHRYLATGVGVLILAMALLSWAVWRGDRRAGRPSAVSPWWASATLVWVCLQGAFGAWTVTLKLYPAIVTAHLLGGLVLLALLAAQSDSTLRGSVPVASPLRRGVLAVAVLAAAQITLGGWVSTNYAVLACGADFPTCQGRWWPAMDFGHGFALLRPLGVGADGAWLPFDALVAIHMTHRVGAVLLLPTLVLLAWRMARVPALRRLASGLLAVAAWQLLSGLGNVVLGWPLVAAIAHTGGAGALVLLLAHAVLRTRDDPQARARAAERAAVALRAAP